MQLGDLGNEFTASALTGLMIIDFAQLRSPPCISMCICDLVLYRIEF